LVVVTIFNNDGHYGIILDDKEGACS
jgi:hypothetical protein